MARHDALSQDNIDDNTPIPEGPDTPAKGTKIPVMLHRPEIPRKNDGTVCNTSGTY